MAGLSTHLQAAAAFGFGRFVCPSPRSSEIADVNVEPETLGSLLDRVR